MKELLVGLSEEDKREVVSFMGSVNTQARNTLQVRGPGKTSLHIYIEHIRQRNFRKRAAAHSHSGSHQQNSQLECKYVLCFDIMLSYIGSFLPLDSACCGLFCLFIPFFICISSK